MIPEFIKKSQIPHKPGVYQFKNAQGKIIYVGKAIDLYHRVGSYFSGKSDSLKTSQLVFEVRGLETTIVESELEALILEANLIKKYLPKFNIKLTDDKDYLYIAITKEDFPKIITARKKDLKPISEWFGPFPSSKTVKNTLRQLRRVFPWCSNPPRKIQNGEFRMTKKKPCFYYHIGLCPGACVGAISKEDYHQIIKRFSKFMSGQKDELIKELEDEMKQKAQSQQFEEAQLIKKTITGITYLTQTNRVTQYLENPNFLEDEGKQALNELQRVLNLPRLPDRIEAYDISNISGTNATGSMVVLTNGEVDKSQYRRFKIKITGKPNDYAMHAEMMRRRLNNDWPLPQLFLIDGGRGQVRAVHNVILNVSEGYNLYSSSSTQNDIKNIPIYGIAKRFEWLYPPEGEVVKLPKRNLALRLLQKIRDESHRFAITYHRKLRAKAFGV